MDEMPDEVQDEAQGLLPVVGEADGPLGGEDEIQASVQDEVEGLPVALADVQLGDEAVEAERPGAVPRAPSTESISEKNEQWKAPAVESIKQACSVPAEMRTDEQVNRICSFMEHTSSFFPKLSEDQQRALCLTITCEYVPRNCVVFRYGDPGDKFYVVLSGGVAVHVPLPDAPCPEALHSPSTCTCPNRATEKVNFLHQTAGFGEVALQSNKPRSATIMACEGTHLLVIKRSDYQAHANKRHAEYIEQRVGFLRRCAEIQEALASGSITTSEVEVLANCLTEVHSGGRATVCRQGEPVGSVIFVRSGHLQMLRNLESGSTPLSTEPPSPSSPGRWSERSVARAVQIDSQAGTRSRSSQGSDVERRSSSGADSEEDASQAGSSDQSPRRSAAEVRRDVSLRRMRTRLMEQQKQDSQQTPAPAPGQEGPTGKPGLETRGRTLRVGQLGAYDMYGASQLANNSVHQVSLVSNPVADLYVVEKREILRLPRKILSALFAQAKEVFPDDGQLLEMHRQRKRWEAYRKGLHAEALSSDYQGAAPPRWDLQLRQQVRPPHRSNVDPAGNLAFLGKAPEGAGAGAGSPARAPPPAPPELRAVALSFQEVEQFSHASACFMRRFCALQHDPSVRRRLEKEGLARHGAATRSDDAVAEEEWPVDIRRKLQWSRLRQNPGCLDLDLDGVGEEPAASEQRPETRSKQLGEVPFSAAAPDAPQQQQPSLPKGPRAGAPARPAPAAAQQRLLRRREAPAAAAAARSRSCSTSPKAATGALPEIPEVVRGWQADLTPPVARRPLAGGAEPPRCAGRAAAAGRAPFCGGSNALPVLVR